MCDEYEVVWNVCVLQTWGQIHNGHNLLFIKLSQEVHNKMPMLASDETILMTARIL